MCLCKAIKCKKKCFSSQAFLSCFTSVSVYVSPVFATSFVLYISVFFLFSFSSSYGWHYKREINVSSRITEAEFIIPWTLFAAFMFSFLFVGLSAFKNIFLILIERRLLSFSCHDVSRLSAFGESHVKM